ncbi:NAD-dependent epimerase/dehydratase family protein [Microbacterium tumbae]
MHHNDESTKRSVLLTGGAGRIATSFAEAASSRHDLTLLDLPGRFTARHAELGRLVEADLSDIDAIAAAFEGIDTVVHLGGERRPGAPWSALLPANIVGAYNVVAAALAAGCRRMVYASSVHAVSGYAPWQQVREDDPVRPGDLYGVTKCFGEALGAHAAQQGLSFIALRIGAFDDPEALADDENGWMLRDYCAPEDLHDLIERSIAADVVFEIFNAVSANRFARLPVDKAATELGYRSRTDSFRLSPSFSHALDATADLADKAFESGFREDLARIGEARR